MTELLSVSKNNGVATVLIDNPPMNVFSQKVTKELGEVLSQLKKMIR